MLPKKEHNELTGVVCGDKTNRNRPAAAQYLVEPGNWGEGQATDAFKKIESMTLDEPNCISRHQQGNLAKCGWTYI